jgi:hypothetical protein
VRSWSIAVLASHVDTKQSSRKLLAGGKTVSASERSCVLLHTTPPSVTVSRLMVVH